jgi:L-threonylcarbamoyladenylate synthase
MSPWKLNRFVDAVLRGAIFGYPTDTIWGIGCHPLIANSAARILAVKNRSPDKGMILLSSRIDYCKPYMDIDPEQLALMEQPTARPTTWLVRASKQCPPWVNGNFATVAIRVTDHPLVKSICGKLEAPIVSTSANRSGKSTVRNIIQLRKQFAAELDFIISGYALGSGQQSEIKSLSSGKVFRTTT